MPLTNGGPVPQSFEPIFGFISVHMMSDQRLATLNQKLDPKPKIGMFLGVQPVASSLQVHHGAGRAPWKELAVHVTLLKLSRSVAVNEALGVLRLPYSSCKQQQCKKAQLQKKRDMNSLQPQ